MEIVRTLDNKTCNEENKFRCSERFINIKIVVNDGQFNPIAAM